jgi:hypothetical protein
MLSISTHSTEPGEEVDADVRKETVYVPGKHSTNFNCTNIF